MGDQKYHPLVQLLIPLGIATVIWLACVGAVTVIRWVW